MPKPFPLVPALFLTLLIALQACAEPTPTPDETPGTTFTTASEKTPAPTFTTEPATTPMPDAVATSTPVPTPAPALTEVPISTEQATEASPARCGELCQEQFWEGGPTPASVQAELDAGADPASKGDAGTPALAYAVVFGSNPDIVSLLLEHGADPKAIEDQSGRPLLHTAVEVAVYASHPDADSWFPGNVDDLAVNVLRTIELLLQGGADAGARDESGQSALFWYLGTVLEAETYVVDPRIVRLLLEHGTEFTAENETDAAVLTYAMWARAGPEAIRMLLEHGADDVVRRNGSDTLLHMAAVFTAGPQVFSLLLEKGEDISAEGEFGRTPLHISVRNGELNPKVIKLLLDNGADVAARDEDGATPLHEAATHSGPEVIRLLLERGADVAARDDLMNTPLHSAMTDGYSVPTDFSPDPEVVRLLLENGASVDARNAAGSTPLHGAAGHKEPDAARLLLAHGADATLRNDLGATPLHRAARATAYKTLTLLLQHGADVNAADEALRTPLHLAAESLPLSPSPGAVRLLLESGAEIKRQRPGGQYPVAPSRQEEPKLAEPIDTGGYKPAAGRGRRYQSGQRRGSYGLRRSPHGR